MCRAQALGTSEELELSRILKGRPLVEGVVIVLSILLAFAIDAAWDYRGARASEAELLNSLLQEYSGNKATLERTVRSVERDIERIDTFYAMSPEQLADLPDDSVGTYWGALSRPMTFQLASGATATALSAGNLDLIRDLQLREFVAGWPARTEDIEERAQVMVGLESSWYDFVPTRGWAQDALQRVRGANLPQTALLRGARGDSEAKARVAMRMRAAQVYVDQMRELIVRVDSTLVLLGPR